jgi:hypothetical protein
VHTIGAEKIAVMNLHWLSEVIDLDAVARSDCPLKHVPHAQLAECVVIGEQVMSR